jgi:hypothetical protein
MMAATLVRATGPSCARRPWLPSGRVPPARAGPVRRAHPPGRAGVVRRGRLHRSGLPPPDARAPPARAGSARRWLPPWCALLGRASARHWRLSWPPRPAPFAPSWRDIGAFPGSPPARGEAHLRQTLAPWAGPALFAPRWRAALAPFLRAPGRTGAIRVELARGIGVFPGDSGVFPSGIGVFPGRPQRDRAIRFELARVRRTLPGWTGAIRSGQARHQRVSRRHWRLSRASPAGLALFAPSWRVRRTLPGWTGAIRAELTRGTGAFPGGIGAFPGRGLVASVQAARVDAGLVVSAGPRGEPPPA